MLPDILIALKHGAELLMHHSQHVYRKQVSVGPFIQHARPLVLGRVVQISNLVLERKLALREKDQWDCHLLGMHVARLLHQSRIIAKAAIKAYERANAIVARGGKKIGDAAPTEPANRHFRHVGIWQSLRKADQKRDVGRLGIDSSD